MISHDKKYIFVHIPKTAGCSVIRALGCPERRDHRSALYIKHHADSEIWQNYLKFSFVRNPWERMVSIYFYCKLHNDFGTQWFYTFIGWFTRSIMNKNIMNKMPLTTHTQRLFLTPQLPRLLDEKGEILVDFIGKVESIQNDVLFIQKKLNLPRRPVLHINTSTHTHYSAYYSQQLIDIVAKWYKEDIQFFNYDFESRHELLPDASPVKFI